MARRRASAIRAQFVAIFRRVPALARRIRVGYVRLSRLAERADGAFSSQRGARSAVFRDPLLDRFRNHLSRMGCRTFAESSATFRTRLVSTASLHIFLRGASRPWARDFPGLVGPMAEYILFQF